MLIGALVQLAAWNTGTNLLYIVSGGVLSFLAAAYLLTRRSLNGLAIRGEAPAAVHRSDMFGVHLRLDNSRRLLPLVSLRISCPELTDSESTYITSIPANTAGLVRLKGRFPRRGVHTLPPVLIETSFPLGLFRRRLTCRYGREVVVYPRVKAVRSAALEQMHGIGDTPRLKRGDGDEFFSLRDYIPGDDPRKIVWRVSARVGHLVVRELEPSTSHNIVIGLDTRFADQLENFVDLFEDAVDLTASLAISFLKGNYAVAVATPEASVPLGEGNAHSIAVLDMLARISPTSASASEDDWLLQKTEVRGAGYLCVSPDPRRWGRRLGGTGLPVVDPREVIRA